ncbi:MAG: hypothetical protein HXY44_15175 [Syntrophaceae bacterium]|nr:hypothetical protein [Syntrophaceae bacterium]
MVQWNVIEILQKFQEIGDCLREWFEVIIQLTLHSLEHPSLEADLNIKKKINTMDPSFRREVGFRYIMETNQKLTSRAASFFLSHRVPLNLPLSLFPLTSFSTVI